MSKEVFVFDVDGVIVDSTEECLVVAWNAYVDYSQNGKEKIFNVNDADENYAKHFRSIRNYVRSMDEYLVVFNTSEGEIDSQSKYEKILNDQDKNELDKYGKAFFNNREELKSKSKNNWIELHIIYDGIVEFFKAIQKKYNVYIVTGKDKVSVIDFLNYFKIEFNFDKIYDKNIAKNKLVALEEIAKLETIENNQISFLDDNVTHLIKPKDAGFNVYLAKWGYGFDEHFKMARDNSIQIIDSVECAYEAFLDSSC